MQIGMAPPQLGRLLGVTGRERQPRITFDKLLPPARSAQNRVRGEIFYFAAALAQKYNCPLMTGDPEFRSITHLELDWIGRKHHPA